MVDDEENSKPQHKNPPHETSKVEENTDGLKSQNTNSNRRYQKRLDPTQKTPRSLWGVFRIFFILLFRFFNFYIHSEHKNLRLFARLVFQTFFILLLLFFGSNVFEPYFAPSTKNIALLNERLHHQENLVKKLNEQLHHLQSKDQDFLKKTHEDVSALKETLPTIQLELQQVQKQLKDISSSKYVPNPVTEPVRLSLQDLWTSIQDKYKNAQPFDQELQQIGIFFEKSAFNQGVLDQLKLCASTPVQSIDQLSKELALLKARLIFDTKNTSKSFFNLLWDRVKSVVRFNTPPEKPVPEVEVIARGQFISEVDKSLEKLSEKNLEEAVAILKKAPASFQEFIKDWLSEADKRLLLDVSFKKLEKIVNQALHQLPSRVP